MSVENNAVFLLEVEGPWTIKESTYYPPEAGQVVIKNAAVAANPIDYKIKDFGKALPFPTSYPAIIGEDVAGEIYEVGQGVEGFKKGDRVISMANWFPTGRLQEGGFQNYTVCDPNTVAHLPANIPFREGCVLPLAINTACMGLYPSARLDLPFPQLEPKPLNKILLVWGGSSSVGSVGIQLAVASGATVIATASSRNFEVVKSLGARVVIDYNDETVIEKLTEGIKNLAANFSGGLASNFLGSLDSIGEDKTWKSCAEVVEALGGGKVATVFPRANLDECPKGVKLLPINDTANIGKSKDITKAIWARFVPEALKAGTLKPFPQPIVAGKGLEKIADGVAILSKGVSARKVVIEL